MSTQAVQEDLSRVFMLWAVETEAKEKRSEGVLL